MSLDTVELIMGIEDEFKITIPDEEASKLETIGDIYFFVLKKLEGTSRLSSKSPNDDLVWERIKKIVVYQLGVKPEQVMKTSHIVTDLGAD